MTNKAKQVSKNRTEPEDDDQDVIFDQDDVSAESGSKSGEQKTEEEEVRENSSSRNSDNQDKQGIGVPPVGRTSDGDPVWLNESKEGKPYLSVGGSDVAIFLNNRIMLSAAAEELSVREINGGGK